jgi:hypothetical protein
MNEADAPGSGHARVARVAADSVIETVKGIL